jgi:hypothetical protein
VLQWPVGSALVPTSVFPRLYYGGPAIVIGWHGDRYWDGRRYWARDDWYRHHPPGRYDYGRDHYDNHRGWH